MVLPSFSVTMFSTHLNEWMLQAARRYSVVFYHIFLTFIQIIKLDVGEGTIVAQTQTNSEPEVFRMWWLPDSVGHPELGGPVIQLYTRQLPTFMAGKSPIQAQTRDPGLLSFSQVATIMCPQNIPWDQNPSSTQSSCTKTTDAWGYSQSRNNYN